LFSFCCVLILLVRLFGFAPFFCVVSELHFLFWSLVSRNELSKSVKLNYHRFTCVSAVPSLNLAHKEKQYAYVAGFQGTIVSSLRKCLFLAQSINLPQKPAIIVYCILSFRCLLCLSILYLKRNKKPYKLIMRR